MPKPVTEVLADEVMFHVGSGKTLNAVRSILDALDLGGYVVVERAHLRTLIAELNWVRGTALSAAPSPSTDSVLAHFENTYMPEGRDNA